MAVTSWRAAMRSSSGCTSLAKSLRVEIDQSLLGQRAQDVEAGAGDKVERAGDFVDTQAAVGNGELAQNLAGPFHRRHCLATRSGHRVFPSIIVNRQ
jgi:hypothetical protein